MSTLKDLKDYLLGKDDDIGYLLNPEHNGKTVMLSGAWGSGKTHFWQNDIEPKLSEKLKDDEKACVYVSLYGKDNIEAIKNEILFKAYESVKDENKLATRAISAFGFGSRLLSISVGGVRANTGTAGDVVESFFESKKIDEAESFLADGGLICLDDFERKSKHIDLNDLFGFIAQLAIDMHCKIVIILNSDVFEGEEANVFKTVKEKTVNKFFYFEPSIEELFNSIYESNEKYEKLDKYKDEILKAIEESEELNARIYIQVLDNCLEWMDKGYTDSLYVVTLVTCNFVLNNIVLPSPSVYVESKEFSSEEIVNCINKDKDFPDYINVGIWLQDSIKELASSIQNIIMKEYADENKKISAIIKYGNLLKKYDQNHECNFKDYLKIIEFVKLGLLLTSKESSS